MDKRKLFDSDSEVSDDEITSNRNPEKRNQPSKISIYLDDLYQ